MTYAPQTGFALLLIAAALVLTLVPEFVYLRDSLWNAHEHRFQVLLSGLADALGCQRLWHLQRFRGQAGGRPLAMRAAFATVAIVVIAAGMLYPYFGIQSRMFSPQNTGGHYSYRDTPSLDGGPTVSGDDDYQAALCLGKLVPGTNAVIASAVGGSYRLVSRGRQHLHRDPDCVQLAVPRGSVARVNLQDAAGSREADIDRLYADPTWNTAQSIIDKYGIQYIVFGAKERSQYSGSGEEKVPR